MRTPSKMLTLAAAAVLALLAGCSCPSRRGSCGLARLDESGKPGFDDLALNLLD